MMRMVEMMPLMVQSRFKELHMLSEERSSIQDEFDKEVKTFR